MDHAPLDASFLLTAQLFFARSSPWARIAQPMGQNRPIGQNRSAERKTRRKATRRKAQPSLPEAEREAPRDARADAAGLVGAAHGYWLVAQMAPR